MQRVGEPRMIEPSRRRLILLLLVGVVGFGVIAAAVGVGARATEPAHRVPAERAYRGSQPPATIALPPFDLTNFRGESVTSAALMGKVVLLTILDAQCTDVCPIVASVVARAIDRLTDEERQQVRALGITADPAEDTPITARRFLAKHRAVGRLDYLLGTEQELRPLWTALQILPSLDSGQDSLHSAPLRIYNRNGVWLATLHAGADLSQENLLHDIRAALAAGGEAPG